MSNLKDVKIKEVTISLDKERHLKYDLNAFAELEDKFGSIDAALNAIEGGSIKAVRTMLWAGLIHEDENLTERQVGAMLDLDSMGALEGLINNAMDDAVVSSDDVPQGN